MLPRYRNAAWMLGIAWSIVGSAGAQLPQLARDHHGADLDRVQEEALHLQHAALGSSIRGGAGLSLSGGELWGVGPDYRVRFDMDAVEFTPAFGARADRLHPMKLSLLSVRRGEGAVLPPVPSAPEIAGDMLAIYPRGDGLIERYEVRPDGVEQSFVFATRPAGTGDLVVRVRVDTDLRADPIQDGTAVRFREPGLGAVEVGAVTGIDARGSRVAGDIRLTGDTLELRLPAAFVDGAVYPLVLDPLLTPFIDVSSVSNDDESPSVAYDASQDLYLVVWQRRFATTDTDVRGQRVAADGTLVGGLIAIKTSIGILSAGPRAAGVAARDRFLVVWTESGGIQGRSVDAVTGSLSAEVTIVAPVTAVLAACPDVGGEATAVDDEALVVWLDVQLVTPFARTVLARQVTISADGTCVPFAATVTIASGNADNCPTISKSGGPSGRYLVTWGRDLGAADSDLRGAVVDRNLTLLDSFIAITSNTSYDENPANDGDGTNWIVGFASEATLGSGDRSIAVVPVWYDVDGGVGSAGAEVFIENDASDDEKNAAVGWLGDTCLVGYADQYTVGSIAYDTYVQSVDLFTGQDCEGEFLLDTGSADDADLIDIASKLTGGATGATAEQALVVWERTDIAAADTDIRAARFVAEDGLVTNLGGGCGSGGSAYATCATVGSSGFTHRVRDATPSVSCYLILSPLSGSVSCGTCTLVPDPFTAFVFAGSTDSGGNAAILTAIPNLSALIGLEFVEQWFVANPPGACTAFGGDLSNALAVQIQ